MPPKAKFTKAEIIEAALNIVRADGYEALTSRALGTYLGSSARPIFTVFKNMEEVQQDMIKSAKALYKEYVNKGKFDKKYSKYISQAFQIRNNTDYADFFLVSLQDAKEQYDRAEEFVKVIEEFLKME